MIVIKQRVIYLIFLISFIIPPSLISFGPFQVLSPMVQIIKYLAMAIIFIDSVKHIRILFKEYKFTLLSGLFGASFFVYFLCTPGVWDFTHLKFYLLIIETYFCTAFLVEFLLKKHPEFFIKSIYIYYNILLWMNFLCMVVKPHGFYMEGENPRYLIALDNGLILYMIPAVLLAGLHRYLLPKERGLKEIITIIVAILSCFISGSATAMVSITVFIVLMVLAFVLKRTKRLKALINVKFISLTYLLITYLVLFRNIIDLFSGFIINVLHRDPTLTSRTSLWQRGIYLLSQAPFYGLGYARDSSEYLIEAYGRRYTSHNNILEILMRGGVVSAIAVVLLIFYVCVHTKKNRKNDITIFITCAYLALLIFYFSEVSFSSAGWTFIFGIMVNCECLIKYKEDGINKDKKEDV